MKTSKSKYKNFDAAMCKILAISHEELIRLEKEWKDSCKKRPKSVAVFTLPLVELTVVQASSADPWASGLHRQYDSQLS